MVDGGLFIAYGGFDSASFHSNIYYTYTVEPRLIIFYVIFGIGTSLAINYIYLWTKKVIIGVTLQGNLTGE